MDFLDDFVLGPMNLINRLEGALRLLMRGERGVKISILRADKGGDPERQRRDARALLRRYRVATMGEEFDSRCVHFLVGQRQARWAEYLLLRAGFKLENRTVDPRNAGYSARHAAGELPRPWAERKP